MMVVKGCVQIGLKMFVLWFLVILFQVKMWLFMVIYMFGGSIWVMLQVKLKLKKVLELVILQGIMVLVSIMVLLVSVWFSIWVVCCMVLVLWMMMMVCCVEVWQVFSMCWWLLFCIFSELSRCRVFSVILVVMWVWVMMFGRWFLLKLSWFVILL